MIHQYLMPFLHLLLEMAPYLLLGFLIAGVLHAFVAPSFFNRYLSGNGFRPVVMSALMGVPLPLCSCGVIPTAMSLRRNGASRGATVSFLISTPQTGVDSILATGALMGIPMALVRPVAAFVTALAGGAAVARAVPETSSRKDSAGTADMRPKGFMPRVREALRYGFVDMMQDIGKWLAIGLVIAGLITILVPEGLFTGLESYPLLNMLIVLAIAVPMYVCATGSIPIAVALMMKGLSPGAALVFLMAGPATNMAAIMVLGKVLERRTTIIYIASIVLGAIACGLFIDYCLPAEWFHIGTTATASGHGIEIFKIACAVIFTVMLVYALGRRHDHHHGHEASVPHKDKATVFAVEGMRCNHCKASVERALNSIDGVTDVEVDLAGSCAVVKGKIDSNTVVDAIEQLGFKCRLDDRHCP